ncbi:hypothetical protein OHU07_30655 [Streptomyces phaeochromogenes]|uniref:hypothetical protein n=1 Tax=Streptomyces phaeochromogenes TaxID=1923 RepID=UPI002E2BEEE9|nr:hypothetical protein [Streptomyces phaeochromogenes]
MLTYVTPAILAASFGLAVAVYRLHPRYVRRMRMERAGEAYPYTRLMMTVRQRERFFRLALITVALGCILVMFLGTYDLFRSWDQHGHFTPPDAPQVVTVFLAILAGVTAAVAALAGAWEKIIRARGEVDNDRIRALAEMERARRRELGAPEVE